MGSALSKAPLQRLDLWKLTRYVWHSIIRRSSAMTTNIFLRNIASWRACGWCSGKIARHILLDQWHHQTICKIFVIKTILSRDGTYFLFYSASLFQLPSYHVRQLDYIHFIIITITVIYHVDSSYHNLILFLCHPYHWNLFHWLQYIFFNCLKFTVLCFRGYATSADEHTFCCEHFSGLAQRMLMSF